MPIIKLSQQDIDGLQCPASKARIEYCDKDMPGLYVLVSSKSDIKSFFLRYKDANGKTCHKKIGRTTDIDLDEARLRAKKLKAEIILYPSVDEKSKQTAITLDQLMDDHILPHLELRNRSHNKDKERYDLRIRSAFGGMRIDRITRQQVQSFHTDLVKIEGLSPSTANRYLALLRRCLNLAVEWNLLETNPVSRIAMYPEFGIEHYLDTDELERLLNVLRNGTKRNFMVRMLAMLLLASGARLNEALRAKWKDIDRENRVWRIPASNSKSKKVRSVPLNDSAIEVLDQLDTEGKFEWLFRSVTGERLTYVHGVWERLREKAGLPHLRLHDLRHQHASFLVNSGRTLYEVQAILVHNDPSVTQRYAHLSTKTLQEASDSASAMIRGAMKKSA